MVGDRIDVVPLEPVASPALWLDADRTLEVGRGSDF